VAEWVVDALVLGALYAAGWDPAAGRNRGIERTVQLVRAFASGAPGLGGRR